MTHKKYIVFLIALIAIKVNAEAIDYFSKPMTRLDFAIYTMRQNADDLFKYALEDNGLTPSVSSAIVTYEESPLEIRIYGRAWGFKESELTKDKCKALLKAYAKIIFDGTFWEKVGPVFRDNPYKKSELGREMYKYFVYEVFLGKEIPMDDKKRVECSATHAQLWPNK